MIKKITCLVFIVFLFYGCEPKVIPTQFSQEALEDTFVTLNDETIAFKNILNKYKGKQVLINVWASWCRDCVRSLPKVRDLQKEHPNVVFVFLSLDKSKTNWKRGIESHSLKGEHYYMQSGWKGPFGKFIDLDWISRYLIVDENQNITLFKAVEANDKRITNILK